ncbi:hypothetical protein PV326_011194, partial [Microctonus aethiopoides]
LGDGSYGGGGDAVLVQKNKTRTIEIEEWAYGAAAVARSCALWTCASGTHSWHTESHKGKAEGKEVEGLLRRFIVDSKSCRLETEALRRREGSMDRVLHTTRILRFCWYSQRALNFLQKSSLAQTLSDQQFSSCGAGKMKVDYN